MEKGVVRESKFRHIFGKAWKKEACITNMSISTSAGLNVIQVNAQYIAVPWSTSSGGALAIIPLELRGKVPDRLPLIDAHTSSILDFRFHPFRDDVLATCAREGTVKLWKLPEGGMHKTMTEPLGVLEGHKSRVVSLAFHPVASDILLSSSADNTVAIWDVEKQMRATTIQGPGDVVQSVVWNMNGTLFSTSCTKDKKLRVYDARSGGGPIHEVHGHDGGKGFQTTFLENDRIVSVGFSKTSQRQISMWDFSGTDACLGTTELDINPSILTPHYQSATGVCTLVGRGDEVYFFELNNDAPYVHALSKSKCSSYNGSAPIPSRACDVKQAEIARFMNASKSGIEPISVIVPRKNAKTVFQEDIFPPAPNGEAGLSAAAWLSGSDGALPTQSLQPKGMPSVFSLSAEEGGKSLEAERKKAFKRTATVAQIDTVQEVPKMSEGKVRQYVGGWWNPWAQRWLVLSGQEAAAPALTVFETDESASASLVIPSSNMADIVIDEYDDTQFRIVMKNGKDHVFKASDSHSAAGWLFCINQLKERAEFRAQGGAASSSTAPTSSASCTSSAAVCDASESGGLKGHLEIYEQGGWFSFAGWNKRWWVVDGLVLYAYRTNDPDESPVENFHLDRVTSVTPSEYDAGSREFTFKLCTPTQVIHLAAESEADRERWVNGLLTLLLGEDAADSIVSGTISGACEGYVDKKRNGLLSLVTRSWDHRWLSAAKKDIYYYESHNATKAPLERLSLQLVRKVVPDQRDDRLFEVHMMDRTIHVHRAESEDERDRIVGHLNFLRQQFLNLFEMFSITDEDVAAAKTKPTPGFSFIDPTAVKKGDQLLLVEVHGRRRVRTQKVDVSVKSFRPSSVFILDAGTRIFQWNGSEAPRVCKGKALDVCSKIRTKERGGTIAHITLDQGKSSENNSDFWKLLKAQPSDVPASGTTAVIHMTRLYRVLGQEVDEGSRIKLIYEGALPRCELLSSKSCVTVDCGDELFVWVGKESVSYQRKLALALAKKLVKEEDRASWATITREVENGETIIFKEKFSNFAGMLPINLQKKEQKKNTATAKAQEKIDVLKAMHHSAPQSESGVDDGSGEIVNMWRVEDFERYEVEPKDRGQFFDQESYIIHYKYMHRNKEANMVYFWQGRFSSRNEKGTSAYMTVDVSEDLSENEQTRVEQGKECAHFRQVFNKLHFVVLNGRRSTWSSDAAGLYRMVGTDHHKHPTQVHRSASSLSSLTAFVLAHPPARSAFVWCGVGASDDASSRAQEFARHTIGPSGSVTVVEEGKESDDFWKALGGKKQYFRVSSKDECRPPRLFNLSGASGTIKVEEVFQYCQTDLDVRHISILDAFSAIYVWIGKNAPQAEKKMAVAVVQEYIQKSPFGHDVHVPVWVVNSYTEPEEFTVHFPGWSEKLFPKAMQGKRSSVTPFEELASSFSTKTFSYAELKQDPLPSGVDPTKLETYLSDGEFEEVFAMSKAEFRKLPVWKVEKMKQSVGLF